MAKAGHIGVLAALTLAAGGCEERSTRGAARLDVVSSAPRQAATGVALEPLIRLRFSEALLPESVEVVASFGADSRVVGTEVEVSSDTALEPLTEYFVRVTAAQGESGAELGAPFELRFTTRRGDPPAVTAFSPEPAAVAGVDTEIWVRYDQAMDARLVNADTVFLQPGDPPGLAVVASRVVDEMGRRIVLRPQAPLQPNTSYRATFRESLGSAAGVRSEVDWVWRFETGDGPAGASCAPGDCSLFDTACSSGACADGACSREARNDGNVCDSDNPCAQDAVCRGGVCRAMVRTDCSALDSLCRAGVCDITSGQCVTRPSQEGLGCDDGEACSFADVCRNGECVGEAYDCDGLACLEEAACDGRGGCEGQLLAGFCFIDDTCVAEGALAPGQPCRACDPILPDAFSPRSDGTACRSGRFCQLGESCEAGECVGGQARECPEGGDCLAGFCDEEMRECRLAAVEDGTACDAGPCALAGECQIGACVATEQRDCSTLDDMCGVGVCNPDNGECVIEPQNDGETCDDGLFCTVGESCSAGQCSGTALRDCAGAATGVCLRGLCDEGAGACVGVLDPNEEGCPPLPGCGNGVVETGLGETCDDGDANSDEAPGACRTDCQPARCGDGVVDVGERCDDGGAGECPDDCDFVRVSYDSFIKAPNADAGDLFGTAVDIDGDLMVIGAPGEDSAAREVDGDMDDDSAEDAGAAYVYRRVGGVWQFEAYLKANNADPGDAFGRAVAVDGDTVIIAAPTEASSAAGVDGDAGNNGAPNAGAVYVFRHNLNGWEQEAYLKGGDFPLTGTFGTRLWFGNELLFVGAPVPFGRVYEFRRTGTTWDAIESLQAPTADPLTWFGYSIAAAGDELAVGAHLEADQNGVSRAGAVYLYTRTIDGWSTPRRVVSATPTEDGQFGSSLVWLGDKLLVGAPAEQLGRAYFVDCSATCESVIAATPADSSTGGFGAFAASNGRLAAVRVFTETASSCVGPDEDGGADVVTVATVLWADGARHPTALCSSDEAGALSSQAPHSVSIEDSWVVVGNNEDGSPRSARTPTAPGSLENSGAAAIFSLSPQR